MMNEIDVDLDLGLNPFCFETELKIETRKKNLYPRAQRHA